MGKRETILKDINEVLIDVLDNEEISISETTVAADIEEWDSLSHIQIVVGIEKHFGIRFTSKEIQSWKNIGEMITSVESK